MLQRRTKERVCLFNQVGSMSRPQTPVIYAPPKTLLPTPPRHLPPVDLARKEGSYIPAAHAVKKGGSYCPLCSWAATINSCYPNAFFFSNLP